ncbi:N-alpha-acetyltransferase 38, NatC auxiliary subunit isoform X1 [Gouania willdenowi]|uniref:N-alpha-acetyltransferase 38, NatC auxiliary subunit isoform X1 n=1 Tax=Gouania willdenowi TaxID=441366 RepID=UPI001055F996|nr:N-alpha-acetyltransferase 38, NatC auxiliary subunit isoform X1 [Gouania willdenowi]
MATMIEENGPSSHQQQHSELSSSSSSSSEARQKLESLLNKNMRIRMTDGRTLVGLFLCTDRDCNVILGSAQEFLKSTDTFSQGEPRVLGLAMIPGHHVVSIEVEAESLDEEQGFGANH